MGTLEHILDEMTYATTHIADIVRKEKAKGRIIVACMPVHTAEELVYASGAFPVGAWGAEKMMISRASEYLPPYACSVVQSITELGAIGAYDNLDAAVVSCLCDTLKCLTQNFLSTNPNVKMIAIKYPQNHKLEGAVRYLMDELFGIKNKLEELTGKSITDTAIYKSIEIYNENRKEMMTFVKHLSKKPGLLTNRQRHTVIKSRYFMDKAYHTGLMKSLNTELAAMATPAFNGIRVYAAGIMIEPQEILDVLDELDYAIVYDELAHETRQFYHPVPDGVDQIERLARQFQTYEGNPLIYDPFKKRAEMIASGAKENNADAVLYVQLKFCDPDEYDYPWVRKAVNEAGLPIMNLEIEQSMQSVEPVRTRLQAFAEQLTSRL